MRICLPALAAFLASQFLWTFTQAQVGSTSADYAPEDFPGPVWEIVSGIAVVDALSIPHSSRWQHVHTVDASGSGPTGAGALRWAGPNQGLGFETDYDHIYQGSSADWLVLKFWVTRPGFYTVQVWNHHFKFDGDNDIWVGRIGSPAPIHRSGSNEINLYSWLTWGSHVFNLQPGLNAVYIAGRSNGFAVDRVVLYLARHEATALDLEYPTAKEYKPTLFRGPDYKLLTAGWVDSEWGLFNDFHYPFVYHQELSWLYIAGQSDASFFFYSFGSSAWSWTSRSSYPWYYDYGAGEWRR